MYWKLKKNDFFKICQTGTSCSKTIIPWDFPPAGRDLACMDYNSFWKIHCFNFFPYKSIGDQIWTCHKIGQGQPKGIIWTNLEVLYAAHQVSRSSAFWFQKRRFLKLYTIYWYGNHLGHVTWIIWTAFVPPSQGLKEALHEIWLQLVWWLLRKRTLKILNMRVWMKVNEWPWFLVLMKLHVRI